MTKWRYYSFVCAKCNNEVQEVLFDEDTEKVEQPCSCGCSMVIKFEIPNVMLTALPDGTNRGRDFDAMKEKIELMIDKSDATPENKKIIDKEIKKLGV